MMNKHLEIFTHDAPGYQPQVDYGSWRVALLNACDMYLPDKITYFDRHLETDEVFILLGGSCGILLAGAGDKPENACCTWLTAGKIYNVPAGVKNTGIDNSPRYYFGEEERHLLIPALSL